MFENLQPPPFVRLGLYAAALWAYPIPIFFLDRIFDPNASTYRYAHRFYETIIIGGVVLFGFQLLAYSYSLGVAFNWEPTKPLKNKIPLMWITSELLLFVGPYAIAATTLALTMGIWRIVDWRMQYVAWCGVGFTITVAAHVVALLLGIRATQIRARRRPKPD